MSIQNSFSAPCHTANSPSLWTPVFQKILQLMMMAKKRLSKHLAPKIYLARVNLTSFSWLKPVGDPMQMEAIPSTFHTPLHVWKETFNPRIRYTRMFSSWSKMGLNGPTVTERERVLIALMNHAVVLYASICICLGSPLIYSGFSL